MRPPRVRLIISAAVVAAFVAAAPPAALAAEPQAPPARPAASSVVVERVENTAIFAPDFKYTDFDGTDGFLLGGYGGVLLDNTLFLGGAGYWIVNGDSLRELGYGGVLVEWHLLRSKAASVSIGGLGGVGWTRLPYAYAYPLDARYPPNASMPHRGGYGYYGYGEGTFMVGEPQVSVVFKLSDGASIAANVGYRFAAFASGEEDRLRGITGGVSIRFGSRR